jgi:excisionase family DNA binding protein
MTSELQGLIEERLAGLDRDQAPDDVICFTIAEVARLMRVSRDTVRREANRGNIALIRVAKQPRITLHELRRYLRRTG